MSFVVAVVWIDFIANEIMAVLFTFGVVFQLSDAILGLTILAWGNSVGGKSYSNTYQLILTLTVNFVFQISLRIYQWLVKMPLVWGSLPALARHF